MGTVDVVVPCYNYGRYLRTCVRSVLSQSGVAVRVLVIDDASSDETAEVGQELAITDSRVEFRRHEVNRGHIATYNEGLLGWARAKYSVLLSADDMLTPDSLSRAVRIMENEETIGMVYGPVIHFKGDITQPRTKGHNGLHTVFPGSRWLEARCRAGHNVITSPEVVVRTNVQQAVGGYCADLPHAGDLEMWLRIAAVSDLAFVRKIPQALYRVHSASMTNVRTSFVDMRERKAAFDMFFHRHDRLANADRLHDLANRAIAREALWRACRAYDRDQLRDACADELVEFALMIYHGARLLPEYRALCRRQRLGPLICHRTQAFALSALVRKVQRGVARRRWKRRGI